MFPVILLSIMVHSAPLASGSRLESRAAQSAATCSSDFAWMDNSNNVSPCQVASSVDALCNNGVWNVPALNASVNYDNPSAAAGTASLCTCSWASYNLISACMACQNFPEKIPNWTPYVSDCAGRLSNTYFPSNLTLPQDVLIPFWAAADPTSWPNQKFDANAAKNINAQGQADLGTPPPSKKTKPVGAIVGGVIGGLVIVAGAIAVAFYMIQKQRKVAVVHPGPAPSIADSKPPHMRSTSDMSRGYTTLSSTQMATNPPTSPTILTHNSSIRSLPYFSSVAASTAPYGSPSPPPGRQLTASPPTNREDIIVPFTLPPTNDNPDRKQANGVYPIYDPPSAPPPPNAMRMEIARPQTPTQRTRYNPPAYTEASPDTSGSSSGAPRHRGKQGSTDTHSSTPSRSGIVRQQTTPGHTPGNSGSSMGMVGQLGVANPTIANVLAGESAVPLEGHGRQVATSRDEKRRPTEDGFTGRDIA